MLGKFHFYISGCFCLRRVSRCWKITSESSRAENHPQIKGCFSQFRETHIQGKYCDIFKQTIPMLLMIPSGVFFSNTAGRWWQFLKGFRSSRQRSSLPDIWDWSSSGRHHCRRMTSRHVTTEDVFQFAVWPLMPLKIITVNYRNAKSRAGYS